MTHKITSIHPDVIFQKLDGTSIKSVVVLRSNEKINIEIERETMTIKEPYLCFSKELPRMIGRRGSTQGASTVRTPEKNASKSRSIDIQ